MRTMTRLVGLLALVAVLVAMPAQGRTARPWVKNTNGWIETIDMDGPRIAYDVRSTACNKVFVWNVQTGGGARVSGARTCAADSTSTGAGVRELAAAGLRIAWIVNLGGNTESADYLYTAALPRPKETMLASAVRTGDVDGTLRGGWLAGLVGDTDLIAVDSWKTDATGKVIDPGLYRVDANGLTTIASGIGTLQVSAADSGRVAVARRDGTVGLYSSTGRLLQTIAPSSLKGVALRKDYVVVLTRTQTVEIYNANTGAFVKRLPVAPGAARLDVHSGLAVYAVGRAVHVLRLSDRHDAVLATAPRAITGLEIESPGVAYAYNTVRGIKEVGNLAFVPLAKATSLLG
jgi:hypothetical protein